MERTPGSQAGFPKSGRDQGLDGGMGSGGQEEAGHSEEAIYPVLERWVGTALGSLEPNS